MEWPHRPSGLATFYRTRPLIQISLDSSQGGALPGRCANTRIAAGIARFFCVSGRQYAVFVCECPSQQILQKLL